MKILSIFSFYLFVQLCLSTELTLKIGKILIPKSTNIYIAPVKVTNTYNEFMRDIACTNVFSCLLFYMMDKGISSLNTIDVSSSNFVYPDTALMKIVDYVRHSDDRYSAMIYALPEVADVIFPTSDFKPIVEILWNSTHYLFISIYPSFDHISELQEYTYNLYIQYCLPIIKDNYLSRCRVIDPYIYAEIGGSRAILSDDRIPINQVRENSTWWTTITDSIVPDISISEDDNKPIEISNTFKENFFSSRVIGEFFIFQHGSNIEIRRYGLANMAVKITSDPYVLNTIKIIPNTVIFIYNRTTEREYPIFGYINKTRVCRVTVNVTLTDLEKVMLAISDRVTDLGTVLGWIIRNWRMIVFVLVVTLVGMAVLYVVMYLKTICQFVSRVF